MAKDPVCGMQVKEKKAVSSRHDGHTYHFCCLGCKTAFEKDPAKYAGKSGTASGHGGHMGH